MTASSGAPPLKARPGGIEHYSTYVQLVRALLPRASAISLFDLNGELRYSSDGNVDPALFHAVDEALRGTGRDDGSDGQLRVIGGDTPVYLFWLRDGNAATAVLVITARRGPSGDQQSFSLVHSLLKPVLDCLRRDLVAQTAIDRLTTSLLARDRDLEILLATPDTAAEPNPDELKTMLGHCAEHMEAQTAALVVPEKSLAIIQGPGVDKGIVARTHRQLLSMTQVRRDPVIINRVGPQAEDGNGQYRIISSPVRSSAGKPIGFLALYRRATDPEFVERDAQLVDLLARKAANVVATHYDALTGLLTRMALEARMRNILANKAEADRPWSALYIDVDQLHTINEQLGMHVGDGVIARIGELIRQRAPAGAQATRISGDRFAILLPSAIEEADRFAESLRHGTEQLGVLQGDARLSVTLSIGVAPFATGHRDLVHALAEAESACKAAKDRGRNRVEMYQEADASIVRRFADIHVAGAVREAIAERKLRLDAQLILPLRDGAQLRPHYEILLRMLGEDGRTIGPDSFMSAAVRYQLMPVIDRWVVEETIALLRPHADVLASRSVGFAINFSGQSLSDPEFPDFLLRSVEESGLEPSLFCFELTESAAVANIARAETLLRGLRRLGCQIALDDFGTGLSSLSYLRQLPATVLKIDGSFVRDILKDPRSESMVAAIAQLARSMGIETVAEYVETEEIQARIATLGVDYAQGFAVGRPVPLVELLLELPVIAAAQPVPLPGLPADGAAEARLH